MSKKFKFPPIPARRCPDSLKQEMMTRDSRMNKKDMPKAIELYQRAVALNNADAMYNLGTCYDNDND